MSSRRDRRLAHGDFQTPIPLAEAAVRLLPGFVPEPATIVEPTCGRGHFLEAAARMFPSAETLVGADLDEAHLDACRERLAVAGWGERTELLHGDYFSLDWEQILADRPDPLLIVGNPPWVTNAALGRLGSSASLPKRRTSGQRGIDAITGKSNFDISESMLFDHLGWLDERPGALAVLCKESVARKLLGRLWRRGTPVSSARIHRFDAARSFGVAASGGLLIVCRNGAEGRRSCGVHETLGATEPCDTLAFLDGTLIRNPAGYERWRHLRGADPNYRWRSGIKHDCAAIMELADDGGGVLTNGLGETVDLEPESVFPLLKGSDLGNPKPGPPRRRVIVTQDRLNSDPGRLRTTAPRTWDYLNTHAQRFERRASSVYRKRPAFAMFGIGDYSFARWKVAVPAFYPNFAPRIVAPVREKPVMLDDTVCFLPCADEREAGFLCEILASDPALAFFDSLVFRDAKRPFGAEVLRQLHLGRLAGELDRREEYDGFLRARLTRTPWGDSRLPLFA